MASPSTFTEAWLPGPNKTSFYTRTYEAVSPTAVLLYVHGFGEHVGRYEWAHSTYASKGITVFAFDQRGFGRTGIDTDNRSEGSMYCKTSWEEQHADIEWWLRYIKKHYPTLPLFMMGYSMGGGLALSFATRMSQEVASMLSGVVAASPLLVQPNPVPRLLRYVASLIGMIFPMLYVQAPVNIDAFTHDAVLNEITAKDPLCPSTVAIRPLSEVLNGTEQVLWYGYKRWPRKLPLLIVHGTADQVTSCPASREFFLKVEAEDKDIILFQHGYHDLSHETNGVKETFVDDCISWILQRSNGGYESLKQE